MNSIVAIEQRLEFFDAITATNQSKLGEALFIQLDRSIQHSFDLLVLDDVATILGKDLAQEFDLVLIRERVLFWIMRLRSKDRILFALCFLYHLLKECLVPNVWRLKTTEGDHDLIDT